MNSIDRELVLARFKEYTDDYNSSDPKIKLKIDHTYRVANIAEDIARSISESFPSLDLDLVWLCAMLHDIGRFEQVRRYNTFVDSLSVDHAKFGADLLFIHGLLESFGDYSINERHILELAIRNHNRYRMEENLSDLEIAYCTILRDADKIDIFRVNIDTPLEDIYNYTTEELENSLISEDVKLCFDERRAVLRSIKKTPLDNLVSVVCLLHEIEFPRGIEIAKEQGYIDKLLSFKSKNPDTAKWLEHAKNTIWE